MEAHLHDLHAGIVLLKPKEYKSIAPISAYKHDGEAHTQTRTDNRDLAPTMCIWQQLCEAHVYRTSTMLLAYSAHSSFIGT